MDSHNILLNTAVSSIPPSVTVPSLAPPLPTSNLPPTVCSPSTDCEVQPPLQRTSLCESSVAPFLPTSLPTTTNDVTNSNSLLQYSNTFSQQQPSLLPQIIQQTSSNSLQSSDSVNGETRIEASLEENYFASSTDSKMKDSPEILLKPKEGDGNLDIPDDTNMIMETPSHSLHSEPCVPVNNDELIKDIEVIPEEVVSVTPDAISSPSISSHCIQSTSLSISIPHPSLSVSSVSPAAHEYQSTAPTFHQPVLCYTRILLGEITPLLAAMRQATPRWSHHSDLAQDPLVVKLHNLQSQIMSHAMTSSTGSKLPPPAPSLFLEPFLAVIRADDTTGPVTRAALASVNRILCYGLISTESANASAAVEDIANAVTHARFVGTDHGADEVVLCEILIVLKTLLLSPVGHLLTNESVCDLLSSSFRICFETRLSELLRNCTIDALRHMVALLFSRLPQFQDEPLSHRGRRLKMKAGGNDLNKTNKKGKTSKLLTRSQSPNQTSKRNSENTSVESATSNEQKAESNQQEIQQDGEVESKKNAMTTDTSSVDSGINDASQVGSIVDVSSAVDSPLSSTSDLTKSPSVDSINQQSKPQLEEETYTNPQGVKFKPDENGGMVLVPYGMACVQEVLRFLISLTSPAKDQNVPSMITTSLGLITVALEVGGECVNKSPTLMHLVKDELCRNLLMLLKPETKPTILMASLRTCILIFESYRSHVKYQLEMFMTKICAIITSESPNVSYTHKELALESVVQLWQIPGLITELFVNFDCDLYSDNIFEDLTKILSKNAFPVQGLYSTNLLSLEALLTVIDILDSHCLSQQKLKKIKKGGGENKLKEEVSSITSSKSTESGVVSPASGYHLGAGLSSFGFSSFIPIMQPFSVLKDGKQLSREHLLALKEKKKLLATGTDQFNVKPEKGVQFLQDNGILGTTNEDIAVFMKENPKLDKKMIGEYISKKKNVGILSAFVTSFEFAGLRLDQCLRLFLETFRLPGEAPLISMIIEHFSSHWHTSNNEPFGKEDAAFTLAYAVIMLNVDQHNQNAKKQNIPMTLDQFRNNVRGVNDGKDFDQDMLQEIYNAIATEEIIMPAEQTGLVKENYLWKMLLKRGLNKEGKYMLANDDHSFDRDLFAICWGPTVASLSYVFDKSTDEAFIQKSLNGFKKCASISARYGMSDVFDNLVVSLCKFTGLMSTANSGDMIAVDFGSNPKAQLAAKALFRLVIQHGDILRDGWKNVIEVLLQLFRCRLLSDALTQSVDLIEGTVSLYKPNNVSQPRVEPSLFSSLYSYIALGDAGSKGTSPEDEECRERAKKSIHDCHIERLVRESAFLRHEALSDMLKAIMTIGDGSSLISDDSSEGGDSLDEYGHAMLLEVVVQIIIANKDRALAVWGKVHNYLLTLLMTSAHHKEEKVGGKDGIPSPEGVWLLSRCVSALMRVAGVLGRRPDMSSIVLQSFRMLLILGPNVLNAVSLQVVAGIHEVLTLTADHISRSEDWVTVLTVLECAGAGAKPPPGFVLSKTDSERELQMRPLPDSDLASSSGPDSGHCSGNDGSSEALQRRTEQSNGAVTHHRPTGWIMVGRESAPSPTSPKHNEWDIVQQREFSPLPPNTEALMRSVDTLCFLVRERHMTCTSLPAAVQTVRTFVEATLNGGLVEIQQQKLRENAAKHPQKKRMGGRRREDRSGGSSSGGGISSKTGGRKSKASGRVGSPGLSAYDADESDSDDLPSTYHHLAEKLLDLLDTLHTSAGSVMAAGRSESESRDTEPQESSSTPQTAADKTPEAGVTPLDWSSGPGLWHEVLCPLLQGMARYCCDLRHRMRHAAMTCLQRALLSHDLHTLTANQWESCFNKVLFPLLAALVPSHTPGAVQHPEESRLRAATLVQKVYLRHLHTLMSLPTFTALWLTILEYLDKYLSVNSTDHLCDAIPEILKNMLLVMETTQAFHTSQGFTLLWSVTWDRIDSFLPGFRTELFRSHPPSKIHHSAQEGGQVPEGVRPPVDGEQTAVKVEEAPSVHTPDDTAISTDNTEAGSEDTNDRVLSLTEQCAYVNTSSVMLQRPLPPSLITTPQNMVPPGGEEPAQQSVPLNGGELPLQPGGVGPPTASHLFSATRTDDPFSGLESSLTHSGV